MWQGQFCKLGPILASGWGQPAGEGSDWQVGGQWMSFCGLTPCYLAVPESRILRTELGDGAFGW